VTIATRRLIFFAGLPAALLAAAIGTGTVLTANFDAGVEMKRTPVGPVQLGVNGRVGKASKVHAPAVDPSETNFGSTLPSEQVSAQEQEANEKLARAMQGLYGRAATAAGTMESKDRLRNSAMTKSAERARAINGVADMMAAQ
jgi:hypothetical protein